LSPLAVSKRVDHRAIRGEFQFAVRVTERQRRPHIGLLPTLDFDRLLIAEHLDRVFRNRDTTELLEPFFCFGKRTVGGGKDRQVA